jgi:hypothetical protein
MRRFVTLLTGVAMVLTAGTAMATSTTPATRQYAVVTAYQQAIQACASQGTTQGAMRQLYQKARATGYRGYLPTPSVARLQCEVEAP